MPLFCQSCGAEQNSNLETCPQCGQAQPRPATPPAVSLSSFGQNQADAALTGIGGWLTFLCLSLTALAPMSQLFIAGKAFRNLAVLHVPIQTAFRLGSVGAIYLGLSVFSFAAGFLLWKEDRRGPNVAKAYLIISALLAIGLNWALLLGGLHINLLQIVFQRLVYSVVWYSYLSASKRVKLTYLTA